QIEAMTMGTRIAVLKDGLLQQIDTPQTLYDHPTNIFVAGFIGSPAMNFFNVKVAGNPPEDVWVEGTGFRLKTPVEMGRKLADYVGKDIVLGIRPEHIADLAFAQNVPEGGTMNVKVDVVEPMGSSLNAYLLAGTSSFIATLDARSRIHCGGTVDVAVETDHLHAFDRQTERVIY
ncbi:MAG: TOBE domain-containing protein, partial [Chloroflexota bacterium]